ncbi:helix-turn-helix domain-containing protein [Nocardia sp. AG03]|uniref:helix-turn-helix domain-containing protein n=1 Tax=Nocardia sp. AG03 TaxID=3025312 RepID=UPI0024184D88|nr:helix-turn-helix domain-containing protein [Nocardia sp. AG03]
MTPRPDREPARDAPALRRVCAELGIGVLAVSEHVGAPRPHRALPVLSPRLVVSLDGPMDIHYDTVLRRETALVVGFPRPGIAAAATTLRPSQPIAYVELSPWTWHRLTRVPLSELDAGGASAEAILPWVDSLAEELADHPAEHREAVLRARLLDRLWHADHDDDPDDAMRVLDLIGATHGTATVEDLARAAHLSPRRLRVVMRRSLGIGPKFASRIVRLGTTLTAAGAQSWTALAAEHGYHDQSHLIREFRDLMGTSPTTWLTEEGRNLQGEPHPAP